MVDNKMMIPKTITVGYQKRGDTYTGKLAYVIYTDDKGKLRKEKSWESWRQKNIKRDDFDNTPTSGFVLNKGVGGTRESYGWNARNEYIRVYDPRNFEFEISVANLLFILQECSSIKGKGLEGEFIYSWSGTELVLLPVNSKEYEECVKHTARQKIKFDKKDIKEGFSYVMKDGTEVLYLGRHNYNNKSWHENDFSPTGKRHIFLRLEKSKWEWDSPYLVQTGFTKIAECNSSSALSQFPDEYEKFKKSAYCGDVKEVKLIKIKFTESRQCETFVLKEDGKCYTARVNKNHYYNRYSPYHGEPAAKGEWRLHKSKASFEPELKGGTIKLPPLSQDTEDLSANKLAQKDFYTVNVVTKKGKKLRVQL